MLGTGRGGHGGRDDQSRRAVDPASTRTEPADEATDATDWSLPDCPACGRPVWVVTVNGPSDATASPCGCSVPPGSLERE